MIRLRSTLILAIAATAAIFGGLEIGKADDHENGIVRARVVAIGIPGVSAVAPVGTFLPGGPIHDNPAFAAFTLPGHILDTGRILVGSTSNFGEPLAAANQLPGSLLSIDPRCPGVLIPPENFASYSRSSRTCSSQRWSAVDTPTYARTVTAGTGAAAKDTQTRSADLGGRDANTRAVSMGKSLCGF